MDDDAPAPAAGLTFTRDANAFLAEAGALLAADPLVASVVAVVAGREAARALAEPGTEPPAEVQWFATVRDASGTVTGAAMRTAPFGNRPAFVLPMAEDDALELARAVHGRGELLAGVNGALPTVHVVAEETARLWGGTARVAEHTRLHELGDLVVPPAPPGRLRPAAGPDTELCREWFAAFELEAAAQAGRAAGHDGSHVTREDVARRIAEGTVWLWEDAAGTPVHLTAASLPVDAMSRIGPVLTPREHRGRGYAARAVAEVARRRTEEGSRVSLFADRANATSNALYARLGFRPVLDMAHVVVDPG